MQKHEKLLNKFAKSQTIFFVCNFIFLVYTYLVGQTKISMRAFSAKELT